MNVKIGRDCFIRFCQEANGGLYYVRWRTFSFHEVWFSSWLSEQVSASQVYVFHTLWDDGCDKATSCMLGDACPKLDSHYSFRFCRTTWSPILHRCSLNPGNPRKPPKPLRSGRPVFLRGCPEMCGCSLSSPEEGGLRRIHTACRAHAVLVPRRAAKDLECVFPI